MSGRLVAAMTMIPSLGANPSISTKSWFSVCSFSSWPPPKPAPRCRPTASISSMKITAGVLLLAVLNRSLTRDAPTPTNISTKSEPEMEKKGTLASPATALAMRVLPVPGGPTSRTPLGMRAPTSENRWGSFKKSTISCSSSFSSSAPATSLKVMGFCPGAYSRARDRPKLAICLPPPCCRYMNHMNRAMDPNSST